tara:strand:- start:500 stop:694 length:195 start_codon:yes stop_codon:yes gene_type:complete
MRLFPYYSNVSEDTDLPQIPLDQIAHFSQHYKDLEPDKWVKIQHWGGADEARTMMTNGIAANSR